ncbi:MAG: hypothetical protein OJF60_002937 [Burkholderiaceae bacterium]|nr:MAG: hypothetical protein OJF60_002937 [Burkholderiaceae bacterium]
MRVVPSRMGQAAIHDSAGKLREQAQQPVVAAFAGRRSLARDG